MKIHSRSLPFLSLLALLTADDHRIYADTIASANLNVSLNGDAFANGADVAYIESPGITYDPSQPFMEFAGNNSSDLPGRPLPPPANFDTVRAGWVRPDSSSLRYNWRTGCRFPSLPSRHLLKKQLRCDPRAKKLRIRCLMGFAPGARPWWNCRTETRNAVPINDSMRRD